MVKSLCLYKVHGYSTILSQLLYDLDTVSLQSAWLLYNIITVAVWFSHGLSTKRVVTPQYYHGCCMI